MRALLERLIGEDVVLELALDPSVCCVVADRGQMEQVLMNLCVNARDAMPAGGRLGVHTGYVLLEVADTGQGMDAETLEHVFEPLFTTKEVGKGTGLGLATVYGIVRQSGGHISVTSAPGSGTTFRILLPQTNQAVGPAGTSDAPTIAPAPTGTILLVEDNAPVRDLVHEILEQHHFTVLEASSAGDAVVIATGHEGPIDLMITDVVMPGRNGGELVGRMEQVRPGMPVLYMSGYGSDVLASRAILPDHATFLQKPFTEEALIAKIGLLLCPRAGDEGSPPARAA
jgi:two-component system cell cycle sensor histidine kinase/response regulator CckA